MRDLDRDTLVEESHLISVPTGLILSDTERRTFNLVHRSLTEYRTKTKESGCLARRGQSQRFASHTYLFISSPLENVRMTKSPRGGYKYTHRIAKQIKAREL